jgi:putative ABC transport system ATP-binding protein
MLELLNITKTFNAGKSNAFTALKGVDLKIDGNGVTVFRGPSGSGKTTLLSVIGCMLRPTSGRMVLDGRETTSLPERFAAEIRRKTFGFVSQNFNLIRGLSTLENAMIPAYPTGQRHSVIKGKAKGLLERLGLASKASQKVEDLSGGEQQRTVIARALINDPSYVIADEPTAHLDTDLAGAFIEIVSELIDEGKTVLIASHDPLIYNSPVVHRVISMRDGAIVPEAE